MRFDMDDTRAWEESDLAHPEVEEDDFESFPTKEDVALMLDAALDALDPEPVQEGYVTFVIPVLGDEDVPF